MHVVVVTVSSLTISSGERFDLSKINALADDNDRFMFVVVVGVVVMVVMMMMMMLLLLLLLLPLLLMMMMMMTKMIHARPPISTRLQTHQHIPFQNDKAAAITRPKPRRCNVSVISASSHHHPLS